jgi:hypothetical protein
MLETLLTAILEDDRPKATRLLKADSGLATLLIDEAKGFEEIGHWIYAGDTALHLAAAGHRAEIARTLIAANADPNSRKNRRESGPLHYAADGYINLPSWDENRQIKTVQSLLDAGAEIDAQDKNGATPLHRAVRTRCAAAVKCLLDRGANPTKKNKSGSTPFHLAVQNTGRGGTGAQVAIDAQRRIVEVFLSFGVKTTLKDGKGRTVLECANSDWVREMFTDDPG